MLCSDAQGHKVDISFNNINTINLDVISQIERQLDTDDLISVVFILYDVPDTALQRLIVFQRISKDVRVNNLNLLNDWALYAQARSTWKYEFLEALTICQLFYVIRNLGLHIPTVKRHFLPDNINKTVYVNPMKKVLYKLCENITADNLVKLQNTLKTYQIDTTEYKICELVILDLMCKGFITIENINNNVSNRKMNIESLARIVERFPGLQKYATSLREIESRFNGNTERPLPSILHKSKMDEPTETKQQIETEVYTPNDFGDLWKILGEMNLEDTTVKNLKSDTRKLDSSTYAIKNPNRVGVCYIINQEDFHPSKESIEASIPSIQLDKRHGTMKDKEVLDITMTALKFEVISHRNIGHKQMMQYIEDIVQNRVHYDDSMFMLCILSHGVRGHVYAADSVKVNIDDIQKLLDDSFEKRQLEIPKIMILQACQVNNEVEPAPQLRLVPDGPNNYNYYLRKSHFLIYWATAPELEAYRDELKGSIFIQILCYLIQKFAKSEHLYEIFTKVNDGVARICIEKQCVQVPIFESTLRKKLYLRIPQ